MENTQTGAPEAHPSDYVAEASFDSMGLSEAVRRAVAEKGYQRPTPVQVSSFPPIRAGKDVIVRSKTGTGKTAAFAMPILDRIPDGRRKVSCLVMCPTRELAIQVAQEFEELAKHKDLSVVAIYGGASMGAQLDKLKAGAEIVVGTPGRIFDHIKRKTLNLDECMVSCLDEADEMLNMGFFEEVTRILDHLPDTAQQLLFSATVPADIEQIISQYLTDPETILLSGDEYSVENINNILYAAVDAYPKPRNLLYMLETEEPETAIVFCNTRSDTSLVTAVLNRNGYDAELLNGDLPQSERERVMAKVKRGEVRFMVATDIAARGIDISDLSHVVNYSLPEDPAVFLHRVGRTGRIGKKGTSLSIVSGAEIHTLTVLEKKFGLVFERKQLPPPEEARKRWSDRHIAELKEAMSATIFEAFIPLAQDLRGRPDGEYLMAFALKYFFTHHRIEKMTDVQKAEHKRAEHERKERHEAAAKKESAARERGDRGGRGDREPRRGRERDRGPDRAERRPAREERAPRTLEERGPRTLEERGPRTLEERGPRTREDRGPKTREDRGPKTREDRGPKTLEVDAVAPAGEAGAVVTEVDRPERPRIFFTLGEQDGADEAKVREAVASLAPGVELRAVEVRRGHSYLEVAPEALDGTVQALNGKDWNGKALAAEKARRRRR